MPQLLHRRPTRTGAPGGSPRLRPGTLEDVPRIAALEADVDPVDADVPGHTPHDHSYPLWAACLKWRRAVQDASYHVEVAECPARGLLAYCSSRATASAVWLEHIGVARDLQGSGLAVRLLADTRARYPGRDLHLLVTESKTRARRFYEREGWVAQEEETPLFLTAGAPMVEYVCPAG